MAINADSIDPMKVFDMDGWKCHLCGITTPIEHRGTLKCRCSGA
jgi:hypothetical protein